MQGEAGHQQGGGRSLVPMDIFRQSCGKLIPAGVGECIFGGCYTALSLVPPDLMGMEVPEGIRSPGDVSSPPGSVEQLCGVGGQWQLLYGVLSPLSCFWSELLVRSPEVTSEQDVLSLEQPGFNAC